MFGTPYKVVRITVPPSTGGNYPDNGGYYRTYANNVFVNKTVLVPYYREEYDTVAFRVLQESLPGYNIVGIDVDNGGQNLISLSGAIHCITHTIGVADPMLITHQSLEDTYDDTNPYLVTADIQHVSGIASATLYWSTTPGASYTAVPMTSGSGNSWSANIPAQPAGTMIYYYVEGNAVSGKIGVRPIVAPQGYWDFKILNASSGLDDLDHSVELSDVFPNPASAITCIPVNSSHAIEGVITLRDIAGKKIATIHDGEIPMGESKYFIMANEYAAGSYQIVIDAGNSIITKKLMIK